MERLLFSLAQLECSAASWMIATGDEDAADLHVALAVELLSGIEQARATWHDPTRRRAGDRRRGG